MYENYDSDTLPQYFDNSNTFFPINDPITGKSVVQDTPLVPIVPYSESSANLADQNSRVEFLKNHLGNNLRIKLNNLSVYDGILTEVGNDFFVISSARKGCLIMIDANSVTYIKVFKA